MPAEPTKELAITSVVGNVLPAFQYTHRHTFAHFPTYTFTQSLTLLPLPMQTNQKQLHSTYAFILPYLQAGRA